MLLVKIPVEVWIRGKDLAKFVSRTHGSFVLQVGTYYVQSEGVNSIQRTKDLDFGFLRVPLTVGG